MKDLPKEFVGRTVRALVFIGLVVVFCTAISSAGLFLASRFGLTKSREQVPLTGLSIGRDGSVALPQRGKMVEGDGWKLRNSRDIYTLTLDNAVIEGDTSEDEPQPGITVAGDLIIELKEGSGSWIKSEGVGISVKSGTLVIRGKGSLEIAAGDTAIRGEDVDGAVFACRIEGGELDLKGGYAGIQGTVIELAGGTGTIEAEADHGIGIRADDMRVEASVTQLIIRGNAGAVIAAAQAPAYPSLKIAEKVTIIPKNAGITQFKSTFQGDDRWGDGEYSVISFAREEHVKYDEKGRFDGAETEITFAGK